MLRHKMQMEGKNISTFSTEEAVWQTHIVLMFCIVLNWSTQETKRGFNQVPEIIVYKLLRGANVWWGPFVDLFFKKNYWTIIYP